jgi:hypothetical protein
MENVAACYDGIVQAFRRRDQARAEKLRGQIIDQGMELLRRYFIEPAAQPEQRKRIAAG